MASAENPNQPTPPVSASGNPNPQDPNNANLMISSPTGGGGGGSVPYSSMTHILYDIDVRLADEVHELEGTPILKFPSVPVLLLGRPVAVNKIYICYVIGYKVNLIQVRNQCNPIGLSSLLKGHAQRVMDMTFFAEDVHLLASASADGGIYIWEITQGQDEDGDPKLTHRMVIAIQIVGEGESFHPRVYWHCHKQEILVVGIGKRVLKIDTTKVGKGQVFSKEKPLRCPVDRLVEGVQLVGTHDGDVTDFSMSQGMTIFLVSASVDGTIKVWDDRKSTPIAVLRPHDGQPVNSVTFLAAPNNPDHIILITGGPLNREVKIWSSTSEEGWLVPSDDEETLELKSTQTLELKSSSAETQVGEAFSNQVLAFSQAGLLLLANAKKNAIYAVHLEYGPNPAATRMDYIAEFTVTMPIHSFTRTSDLLPCEQIVEVYCVHTKYIQKYALNLSHCLSTPLDNAPLDNAVFERSEFDTYSVEEAVKELSELLENIVKKELSAFGQTAAEAITPIIEKAVSSAISKAFQKGVGGKRRPSLGRSKRNFKLLTSKLFRKQ